MKMFKLLAVILLTSCTVVPKPVEKKAPSFDGNVQNSGFLGYDKQGNGIITFRTMQEYNDLVALYGNRFKPPIQTNDGVTKTADIHVFLIDKEHLIELGIMQYWRANRR